MRLDLSRQRRVMESHFSGVVMMMSCTRKMAEGWVAESGAPQVSPAYRLRDGFTVGVVAAATAARRGRQCRGALVARRFVCGTLVSAGVARHTRHAESERAELALPVCAALGAERAQRRKVHKLRVTVARGALALEQRSHDCELEDERLARPRRCGNGDAAAVQEHGVEDA